MNIKIISIALSSLFLFLALPAMQVHQALFDAVKRNEVHTVKLKLEQGDNPNFFINGKTPLIAAIENNYSEIVKLLIEHGANVNTCATSEDPTWGGYSPLCVATFIQEDYSLVKFLCDNGADKNYVVPQSTHDTWSGKTPLHIALMLGYEDAAFCLITAGANVNAIIENPQGPDHKLSPLCMATLIKQSNSLIASLCEYGADKNYVVPDASQDWTGYTPLHMALQQGHENAALSLIEAGADVNIKIENPDDEMHHFTPMSLAGLYGSCRVIQALHDHAADTAYALLDNPCPRFKSKSPLGVALGRKAPQRDIIELMTTYLILDLQNKSVDYPSELPSNGQISQKKKGTPPHMLSETDSY